MSISVYVLQNYTSGAVHTGGVEVRNNSALMTICSACFQSTSKLIGKDCVMATWSVAGIFETEKVGMPC